MAPFARENISFLSLIICPWEAAVVVTPSPAHTLRFSFILVATEVYPLLYVDLIPSMCDVIQHDIQVSPLDQRMALSAVHQSEEARLSGSLLYPTGNEPISSCFPNGPLVRHWGSKSASYSAVASQVVRLVEKSEWMSPRGKKCMSWIVAFFSLFNQMYIECTAAQPGTGTLKWSPKALECVKQYECSNILTGIAVASPKGRELH